MPGFLPTLFILYTVFLPLSTAAFLKVGSLEIGSAKILLSNNGGSLGQILRHILQKEKRPANTGLFEILGCLL